MQPLPFSGSVSDPSPSCVPSASSEEVRSCAGGVVCFDSKVFLLRESDGTWAMPKGVIRDHNPSQKVALWRVEDEAGIQGRIIGIAGFTTYRLFSKSRGHEVMNRIQWFAMTSDDARFTMNTEQGFLEGKWASPEEAACLLTRPGDREIMYQALSIFRERVQG